MKKILSVLLTLIFVFLCACSAQGTQDRQLSAHIDGLIEETTIEWKDDNTAVVSFDKHAVNNVAVKLKKAVSSPLKILFMNRKITVHINIAHFLRLKLLL